MGEETLETLEDHSNPLSEDEVINERLLTRDN